MPVTWERLCTQISEDRHWLCSQLWKGKITLEQFNDMSYELETVKIPNRLKHLT